MELTMVNGFNALSEQEMLLVDGGEWKLEDLVEITVKTVPRCAAAGTAISPGVGTVVGAVVGAAVTAVTYSVFSLFD